MDHWRSILEHEDVGQIWERAGPKDTGAQVLENSAEKNQHPKSTLPPSVVLHEKQRKFSFLQASALSNLFIAANLSSKPMQDPNHELSVCPRLLINFLIPFLNKLKQGP